MKPTRNASPGPAGRRSASLAAALAALSLGGGIVLSGVGPALAAGGAPSTWTLAVEGGDRQCRLTLRPDVDGKGAPVAMPSGCRRAFPGLKGVAFWTSTGDGLRLDDAHGDALLAFDAQGDGFRTTSPQGEPLKLTSVDGKGKAALDRAAAAAASRAEPAQAAAKTASAKAETAKAESAKAEPARSAAAHKAGADKPAEVAGRYAVLRDKTRDTGCMVTLDDKAHGPGATLKARLAPACRDQGIVIFDPVGWQMVSGRLVLTARKGHTTELDTQDDGSWMNDPGKGKTLSLKRI
ncbi:AprI/Inh family metalloprotease inhibitor [Lichenibacterium ramalinae]|nr:AprI/Inh family metalloprotease inhibitor [Lichenibacterium ramalinae]